MRPLVYIAIVGLAFAMCVMACRSKKTAQSVNNIIQVKAYGAQGNGRADDSGALQRALNALPQRGGKLVFDPGTYMLGRGLVLRGKKEFEITGTGATLIAKAGLPKSPQNALLTIENCDHFQVIGLKLDGNRDKRPLVQNQVPGHNFRILDVRHAEFKGVISDNGVQDGFTLQDNNSNPETVHHVKFINCIARNNYRQGLSVINGSEIDIIGGEYSGTNGVEPEAGIDIEANKGERPNTDIRFKGVTFRDNAFYGIVLAGGNTDSRRMTIDGCFFYGNRHGGILATLDETEISRCVFEGNSKVSAGQTKGSSLIDVKHGNVKRVIIKENTFRNTAAAIFGIRLAGGVTNAKVVENTFSNLTNTALAVYAQKAEIVGNQFSGGKARDIQLKGGNGHLVLGNSFTGGERPLMLVEAAGTTSLSNSFNKKNIPSRLLQEKKKLLQALPQPAGRPNTSSRSASAISQSTKLTTQTQVSVDATKAITLTLPASPKQTFIQINRVRGQATITLECKGSPFKSGSTTFTVRPAQTSVTCYHDGLCWRVF
ncbi:MAG: right-handed parallel beta-helix repeat-containing protein [Bacteroidia bacterium]